MPGTVFGISEMEMSRTGPCSHGEGQMHCAHCGWVQQILDSFSLKGKIGQRRLLTKMSCWIVGDPDWHGLTLKGDIVIALLAHSRREEGPSWLLTQEVKHKMAVSGHVGPEPLRAPSAPNSKRLCGSDLFVEISSHYLSQAGVPHGLASAWDYRCVPWLLLSSSSNM